MLIIPQKQEKQGYGRNIIHRMLEQNTYSQLVRNAGEARFYRENCIWFCFSLQV